MRLDLPNVDNLYVAADTETSGLAVDDGARLSIISLAWRDESGVIQDRAYPFDQGPGYDSWLGPKQLPRQYELRGPSLFDRWDNLGLDEWNQLTTWMQRQNLVWHNFKFDAHMLRVGLRNHPETGVDFGPNYVWDSMVVAPDCWPNERVGLKSIAERLWGADEKDLQNHLLLWLANNMPAGDKRYDLAPMDLILPYAADDTIKTIKLYEIQREMLACGEIDRENVDRQIDLALVLYYMEAAGIGYDVPAAAKAETTLLMKELRQQREVDRITGVHGTKDAQLRTFWFEQLKLPIKTLTDTGKASVTIDVVRDLEKAGVPGAKEVAELNMTKKALSNWYSNWHHKAGPDNRLRCTFHQTKVPGDIRNGGGGEKGTISARLAVERINLLAIPHDYQLKGLGVPTPRQLFRAWPGHTLWEVDVSQAEMRAATGLAGCVSLRERFLAGDDAHNATCRVVFHLDETDAKWDFYRQIAKRLNFAILYGAGLKRLVEQIEIFTGVIVTEPEAKVWMDAAKKGMPEIFRMGRQLSKFADTHGFIELVGGKRRYFRPGEFTFKALNAKVQGSVAVAMIDSMIDVHAKYGPGLMLLQIHDSLVLEPRIEDADEIVRDVQHTIEQKFELLFGIPFKTDAKAWLKTDH